MARVATNSFWVKSLMDDAIYCLPGDQLIKVSNLDEDGMRQLVRSMESSAAKGIPQPSCPRTRARASLEVDSINWFAVPQEQEESVILLCESSLW